MNGGSSGPVGSTRGAPDQQHPARFADYFVICGLDKDSGLEPDKYFGQSILHCLCHRSESQTRGRGGGWTAGDDCDKKEEKRG